VSAPTRLIPTPPARVERMKRLMPARKSGRVRDGGKEGKEGGNALSGVQGVSLKCLMAGRRNNTVSQTEGSRKVWEARRTLLISLVFLSSIDAVVVPVAKVEVLGEEVEHGGELGEDDDL
jgi:hypothetical protein